MKRLKIYLFIIQKIQAGIFFQESSVLKNFKYENCNTSAVPLYVHQLDISPDPIILGEWIQVSFNMTLDKDAGSHNKRIEVIVARTSHI